MEGEIPEPKELCHEKKFQMLHGTQTFICKYRYTCIKFLGNGRNNIAHFFLIEEVSFTYKSGVFQVGFGFIRLKHGEKC